MAARAPGAATQELARSCPGPSRPAARGGGTGRLPPRRSGQDVGAGGPRLVAAILRPWPRRRSVSRAAPSSDRFTSHRAKGPAAGPLPPRSIAPARGGTSAAARDHPPPARAGRKDLSPDDVLIAGDGHAPAAVPSAPACSASPRPGRPWLRSPGDIRLAAREIPLRVGPSRPRGACKAERPAPRRRPGPERARRPGCRAPAHPSIRRGSPSARRPTSLCRGALCRGADALCARRRPAPG